MKEEQGEVGLESRVWDRGQKEGEELEELGADGVVLARAKTA